MTDTSYCEYCGSRFLIDENTYKAKMPLEEEPQVTGGEENAPPFTDIFPLENRKSGGTHYQKPINNYGVIAFTLAVLGITMSPFPGPSPVMFIISLILAKRQYGKSRLAKAAVVISVIGLIVWAFSYIITGNSFFRGF